MARAEKMSHWSAAASAPNGSHHRSARRAARDPSNGNSSRAANTTADSFERSAAPNDASEAAYHFQPPFLSTTRAQHSRLSVPNRNISSSELPEYHITASWWPSWTAKNAAATAEIRQPISRHAPSAYTSHTHRMCSARLTP